MYMLELDFMIKGFCAWARDQLTLKIQIDCFNVKGIDFKHACLVLWWTTQAYNKLLYNKFLDITK